MMEQLPENNSSQAGISDAKQPASLGMTLREAREHLGLSVADVANQIKFAPRQIEALEADDFKHLPEATFLRGFIRSYAKILQLDAQALLAALPQAKSTPVELTTTSVNVPFPDAHSLVKQNLLWLSAAALLAILAGAFALWNSVSPLKRSKAVQVETPVSLPAEVQIIPDLLVQGEGITVPSVPDLAKKSPVPAKEPSAVPVVKPAAKYVVPTITQSAKPETTPKINLESKPETAPATKVETKTEAKAETKPEVKTESSFWWFKSAAKPEVAPETKLETPPVAKPAEPPQILANKTASPPVKSPKDVQLRLEFGEESWTEIKDRDGKIISSQVNPPGTELIVSGRPPFSMLIGHGLSVRLFRQGQTVDLTPYINKYSEVAHVTLK